VENGDQLLPAGGTCRGPADSAWQSLQMEGADWTAILSADAGARLQFGASIDDLHVCESTLGAPLPSDLRRLYLASNGVWDEPGQWFVIWPLADIAQRNRLANELEGPGRSRWIGFGDDGTGSPFCVARRGGAAVYYWSPIDHSATLLASGVAEFWAAWVAGTLPPH
jgi:hypothetical protein